MNKTRTLSGEVLYQAIIKVQNQELKKIEDITEEIGCSEKSLYNWIRTAEDPTVLTLPTNTEHLKGIRYLFEHYDPDHAETYFKALEQDRKNKKAEHQISERSESDNSQAYAERISQLTDIYKAQLPPELYTETDCHAFALYFSWLSDNWDAMWYKIKLPESTIFEALVHSNPQASTFELAQKQERLDHACIRLRDLGFKLSTLSGGALYQQSNIPNTIFDLYSGYQKEQECLMKQVYRERITVLLGEPHYYMAGTSTEIKDLSENIPILLQHVMSKCFDDKMYAIPMSVGSKMILDGQSSGDTISVLNRIKGKIFNREQLNENPVRLADFDNYQAVRSAIESLIIKHYEPKYFSLSHIPEFLYKLFAIKINMDSREIEIGLTPMGEKIYMLVR